MVKQVLICPKCGSTNVDVNPEVDRLQWIDMKTDYYCFDCKYTGFMPRINEDKIEEFRAQIKENKSMAEFGEKVSEAKEKTRTSFLYIYYAIFALIVAITLILLL